MKIGDKVHVTAAIHGFVQTVGMKKKKILIVELQQYRQHHLLAENVLHIKAVNTLWMATRPSARWANNSSQIKWQSGYFVFRTTNQLELICMSAKSRYVAAERSATSTALGGRQFFLVWLEARKCFSEAINDSAAFCLLWLLLRSALVTHVIMWINAHDPAHSIQ